MSIFNVIKCEKCIEEYHRQDLLGNSYASKIKGVKWKALPFICFYVIC